MKDHHKKVDNTAITGEAQYSINCTRSNKCFSNKYALQATNSEMKSYSLCLVTFQKILHLITWIKTESNRNIYGFSVSYNTIEVSNIVDIHKRT